jgi:coenzyme PQQ precursor peptide PqqA
MGGNGMAWMTPKVVEIAVGLEINSYVCAEL